MDSNMWRLWEWKEHWKYLCKINQMRDQYEWSEGAGVRLKRRSGEGAGNTGDKFGGNVCAVWNAKHLFLQEIHILFAHVDQTSNISVGYQLRLLLVNAWYIATPPYGGLVAEWVAPWRADNWLLFSHCNTLCLLYAAQFTLSHLKNFNKLASSKRRCNRI